jgi:hypothetical protein
MRNLSKFVITKAYGTHPDHYRERFAISDHNIVAVWFAGTIIYTSKMIIHLYNSGDIHFNTKYTCTEIGRHRQLDINWIEDTANTYEIQFNISKDHANLYRIRDNKFAYTLKNTNNVFDHFHFLFED